jgi:hypothetical protein
VAFWTLLQLVSFYASRLSPRYVALPADKQRDWDIRVAAFIHASLASVLALRIQSLPELERDRVFASSPRAAEVLVISSGYFVWDLVVCSLWVNQFGASFLLHGALSCYIYMTAIFPFLQHYAVVFLLYELSTPFIHVHWFLDKLGRSGSALQLLNGVVGVAIFFIVRIVLGLYWSYHFWVDTVSAWIYPPARLRSDTHAMHTFYLQALIILASNIALNLLNIFWFYKMVRSVSSRADGGKSSSKKAE